MSSRGFCVLGNAVFPSVGVTCGAAFVPWAGSGGCWFCPGPDALQGLLSRSKAVFAWGECRSCQPTGTETCFGPSFTWPGPALVLGSCAPAVLPPCPKCVENAAEQQLLCFPPAPLGLSHHFSSDFSGIFFLIQTASCTWLWEKSVCKICGKFCVMRQVLCSALA